ncbi:Polyketide cyclase / dehydrase and lipid transport [Blastococcus sp. DSM 46786]|uniref:SRPBCC family protein n=1 Tax=Blastococcus sp. DSM 46786 TaxID=1798227 RepID=UPI0008C28022|nr:SRPBCC family protein [Blastococcus sp. DSM 46786]SEK79279.1 Polyketide cyclase / dehydrase and lipid transport [Blastococcus sp. DSM 46786]
MARDVDVVTEAVIHRPRAQVAAFAGDPGRAPEWYRAIDSVEWRTPPPVAVGSRVDFVARFLRRRLAYTYEVAELVPGERLVMRTAQGPFPMETTYTWEELAPGSTRMTLRNRGRPAGFSALASPFVAAAVRRANRADLARLRDLLERG